MENDYNVIHTEASAITVIDEIKFLKVLDEGQAYVEYVKCNNELMQVDYSMVHNHSISQTIERARVFEKTICDFRENPSGPPTKYVNRYKFAVKREVLDDFNITFDLIESYEKDNEHYRAENHHLSRKLNRIESIGVWDRLKFLFLGGKALEESKQ